MHSVRALGGAPQHSQDTASVVSGCHERPGCCLDSCNVCSCKCSVMVFLPVGVSGIVLGNRNPASGCVCQKSSLTCMGHAGRKARYIYGGASLHPTETRPLQCVAKYDLETGRMQLWSKGPQYFMGEPQFISRKESQDPNVTPLLAMRHDNRSGSCGNGSESAQTYSADVTGTNSIESLPQASEDDGWVLSVGFDAELQQSELVLLDASDIEAGPVAILPLQNPVGYGLHGSWVPVYFGP